MFGVVGVHHRVAVHCVGHCDRLFDALAVRSMTSEQTGMDVTTVFHFLCAAVELSVVGSGGKENGVASKVVRLSVFVVLVCLFVCLYVPAFVSNYPTLSLSSSSAWISCRGIAWA